MHSEEVNAGERGMYKFPKKERLGFRTMVDALFAGGKTDYAYPLRITSRVVDCAGLPDVLCMSPLQFMVTVPKKRLHRAVDRVRMRRLIREAWRLQRVSLRDEFASRFPGKMLHVGVVYIDSHLADFDTINSKMAKGIAKLSKRVMPDGPTEP